MASWIFAIIIVCLPLFIGEIIERLWHNHLSPEFSRKIVHLLASVASASLVLFLTLDEISILAFGFIFVMLAIKSKELVKSLYRVERTTYGELFFPVGVLFASLLAKDIQTFVVVMLILGFSDTFASLFGQNINSKKFRVFGSTKSLAGSIAFFITSLIIMSALQNGLTPSAIFALAFIISFSEFLSPYGVDNVSVPISYLIVYNAIS